MIILKVRCNSNGVENAAKSSANQLVTSVDLLIPPSGTCSRFTNTF